MTEDKKISGLPVADTLTGAELVELVQGGVNKQSTSQAVADLGGGGGGAVDSVNGQTGVVNLDGDYPNGLPAVDTTGTAIAFAIPQFYGSPGSPESGNITLVTTGLVKGMVQVLYHDNGTEPTYPAEFVKLFGTYDTGVLNVIYMHAISASRIEYTISQEQ